MNGVVTLSSDVLSMLRLGGILAVVDESSKTVKLTYGWSLFWLASKLVQENSINSINVFECHPEGTSKVLLKYRTTLWMKALEEKGYNVNKPYPIIGTLEYRIGKDNLVWVGVTSKKKGFRLIKRFKSVEEAKKFIEKWGSL